MVVTLNKYPKDELPKEINIIISKYKYIFNPSKVKLRDKNYLAIRVYNANIDSIEALLFIWGINIAVEVINLSSFFSNKLSLNKVSDPKIFIMNDEVWGSFNTGHIQKGTNQLGLFNIDNIKIGEYYLCNYNKRNRIEKNWAFFCENKIIYALYSISPLVILKFAKIESENIYFEDYIVNDSSLYNNYSIGTPLVKINKKHVFIGHRKIVRNGKRLYLGKPFSFNFSKNIKLKAEKKYLIHSIKDLFGNKYKFNNNLISCTYFSGIDYSNNELCISYGINDIKWNIIKIKLNKIWH